VKPVTYRSAAAGPGGDSTHQLIFLEGAQQGSGARPGPIIREALTSYGPLDVADYPDAAFKHRQVVGEIAARVMNKILRGIKRFTLIGISKGALIGHDVIELAVELGCPADIIFNLVIVDGPGGGHDLVNKWAWVTKLLPQFRTPRMVNGWVLGIKNPLPTHEPFESEEEWWIWREHVKYSREFPFLYMFGGQTAYIVRHPGPKRAVLARISKKVFVQTANDTIVKSSAPSSWDVGRPITANTEFHASLLEAPREYTRCLRLAMDSIVH
jgi:hypothetical protein